MTSYFNVLSWTRAQKNREALEKTNPQNPVLNEEDENFLNKIASQEAPAAPLPELAPMAITEDGEVEEANHTQKEAAEVILPSSPEAAEEKDNKEDGNEKTEAKDGKGKRGWASFIPSLPSITHKKVDTGAEKQKNADEEKEVAELSEVDPRPESSGSQTEVVKTEEAKEEKLEGKEEEEAKEKDEVKAEVRFEEGAEEKPAEKEDLVETSVQESKDDVKDDVGEEPKEQPKEKPEEASKDEPKEAPKAQTKEVVSEQDSAKDAEEQTKEGKGEPEASIKETAQEPVDSGAETEHDVKQDVEGDSKEDVESTSEPNTKEAELTEDSKPEAEKEKEDDKTSETTQRTWSSYIPAIPSLGRGTKGKEAEKDGEIAASEIADAAQSSSTHEDNEREVSVLLDRLNLSAINNRVFSFSQESQNIYHQFTLILKDMVHGVPTAYDDLESLIKENERHLDQMFKNMPPFVQTLVKSLPSKFMGSMGPEMMAAASEKPGADLKTRMEAASRASASASSSSAGPKLDLNIKKKQKRNVPGVKALAEEKGAVASMLSNILNFLKLRFPAFITGTNILMSLAVFILLFVFWYCHKRGREARLIKETESAKASANVSEVEDDEEEETSEEEAEDEKKDKKEEEIVAVDDDDDDEKVEVNDNEKKTDEGNDNDETNETTTDDTDEGIEKLDVAGPDKKTTAQAQKILEQPGPAEVPLPENK